MRNDSLIKKKVCEANIKAYTENIDEFEDYQNAATYYRNLVLAKNIQHIISLTNVKHPKILEIGCGTGVMTEFFFKFSKGQIYCLDIAKKALDILKSKLSKEEIKRATFVCSDSYDYLRKSKEKFDIIAVHGALHHMVDYIKVFEEMTKHLNKGGVFYITNEPTPPNYYNHYWANFLTNMDIAYSKHLHKSQVKFIAYMLFAPFNFLKPFINSPQIKKLKDRYFHKQSYDDVALAEYWEERGLDINALIKKSRENKIEIISLDFFTIHRTPFIIKLSKYFNVNRFFTLVGRKNN